MKQIVKYQEMIKDEELKIDHSHKKIASLHNDIKNLNEDIKVSAKKIAEITWSITHPIRTHFYNDDSGNLPNNLIDICLAYLSYGWCVQHSKVYVGPKCIDCFKSNYTEKSYTVSSENLSCWKLNGDIELPTQSSFNECVAGNLHCGAHSSSFIGTSYAMSFCFSTANLHENDQELINYWKQDGKIIERGIKDKTSKTSHLRYSSFEDCKHGSDCIRILINKSTLTKSEDSFGFYGCDGYGGDDKIVKEILKNIKQVVIPKGATIYYVKEQFGFYLRMITCDLKMIT